MSLKVALVGHVDNGKSTVIGRLLADSGQTRIERREKVRSFCESMGRKFEYAFLLDALEEEQTQGVTIDVTEVNWIYKNREFTFVDTPGHHEFLKKMIGGASRVDAAVQVVDAHIGINDSFRRQSHILQHLGVVHRIVLVNKMDLVKWDEDIYELRKEQIINALGDSKNIHVLPSAAWSGDNLLVSSEQMPWYKGPTLAELIFSLPIERKNQLGPLRYSVQDVYKFDERRILVGRLESGKISVGEEIFFAPGQLKSRVLSIEKYGEETHEAFAGDAVGISLADPLFIDRGYMGYSPNHPPLIDKRATADLFWLGDRPLEAGDRVRLKAGTQSIEAFVKKVYFELDSESLLENSHSVSISIFGRVEFAFLSDFSFDSFDANESTGRFVVTQGGAVLGGGRWLAQKDCSVDFTKLKELKRRGLVIWFTGFSGAGKSTLAKALTERLSHHGADSTVLDGDNLREGLCSDLGFSQEDRIENLRRAAEVAKLMADAGLIVITAFISPYAASRDQARKIVGSERFAEIFIDCSLAACESRDVKGLYAKARRGEIAQFTGISSKYEAPSSPDLRVNTQDGSVSEVVDELIEFIHNHFRESISLAKESR